MPGEKSQAQKATYCMILVCEISGIGKSIEMEIRISGYPELRVEKGE